MRKDFPHSEPAGNPTDSNKPGTAFSQDERCDQTDHRRSTCFSQSGSHMSLAGQR